MIDELINLIVSDGRIRVIAIDGFGGAGKTTLANTLAEKLPGSIVVRLDSHIRDKKLNNTAELIGFDRQTVIEKYLKNREHLTATTIVEGISALHPDFDNFVDFKIWVDTSLEEATTRARSRDLGKNEYLRYIWDKSAKAYLKKHKPNERAHFLYIAE